MKLQNKYIYSFAVWLNSLSLNGTQSRMRTKFVHMLNDALLEMEKDRKEIAESYAEKDEDGKSVLTKDDKGQEAFKIKDDSVATCSAELIALSDKEITFEVDSNNKDMFDTVKNVVLNTDQKIGPDFSEIYEIACEALEKVA